METKHIKFEYDEALNAKKNLLSAEINILKITKYVRNYKLLKKREKIINSKLKTSLRGVISKLNLINSTFPKQEKPKIIQKREKFVETEKQKDIEKQLKEIQEKLSKLK
jgi:hypothetical protein